MKKVILENRPFEFANAQYNFDNALGLLGSPPDTNIIDKTLETWFIHMSVMSKALYITKDDDKNFKLKFYDS